MSDGITPTPPTPPTPYKRGHWVTTSEFPTWVPNWKRARYKCDFDLDGLKFYNSEGESVYNFECEEPFPIETDYIVYVPEEVFQRNNVNVHFTYKSTKEKKNLSIKYIYYGNREKRYKLDVELQHASPEDTSVWKTEMNVPKPRTNVGGVSRIFEFYEGRSFLKRALIILTVDLNDEHFSDSATEDWQPL